MATRITPETESREAPAPKGKYLGHGWTFYGRRAMLQHDRETGFDAKKKFMTTARRLIFFVVGGH